MKNAISEFVAIMKLFDELITSKKDNFPSDGRIKKLPKKQGVYLIHTPKGDVAHVGRTNGGNDGLLQRINNHISGKKGHSSFTRNYLNGHPEKLRHGWHYQYIIVQNVYDRILLEAYATWKLHPKHLGAK